MRFLAALLILFTLPVWAAEDIVGIPAVVDGDTLSLGNERIRLKGIDAPEIGQTCTIKGQPYDCGKVAAAALSKEIGWSQVRCTNEGRDRYKRILGTCWLGIIDLNQWMVWQGHALAYRKYSKRYVDFEGVAQMKGVGIWRGDFIPPWEWRKRK